ncbi:hydrogenase large subunit [Gordonia sp. NPDC003424]
MTYDVRQISRDQLPGAAADQLAEGRRLATVVCRPRGDGFRIRYVFVAPARSAGHDVELTVDIPATDPAVPSLAELSYPAGRFEREMADLFGVRPVNHPMPKRLVTHAHWPSGWAPMLDGPTPDFGPDVAGYPFAEVSGPGIYEIAVGPVHAGIIEPGHFRFSVVGETIIAMQPRLWFLHRGVEKCFEGRTPAEALHLAEHVTGDTVIGHALAYAMAVEAATGVDVPPAQRRVRAILLELERLANHVTDIGAIANDTGFGIANVHALALRERLLRINETVTGHRFLRGAIRLGGATVRRLPDPASVGMIGDEIAALCELIRGHGMVHERLAGTGVLPTDEAVALGTVGYVARASGIDADLRRDHPFVELPDSFRVCTESAGDVLARFRVREREAAVSAGLVCALVSEPGHAPGGSDTCGSVDASGGHGIGIGSVEAWRGPVTCHVELDDGLLTRVRITDPSFFNWPALPVALNDTIVPDFPLTNKSFNQSYAGNDL